MIHNKKQLISTVALILLTGFFITSYASYQVSKTSVVSNLHTTGLPLTSDTIYSEIQQDLVRPAFIASLMASNTFLHDWALNEENDELKIQAYLHSIQKNYATVTSFFVSEKSKRYYHSQSVLKTVSPDEPRDAWYFRVKNAETNYETNVDSDMANNDSVTIFSNRKVFDAAGTFIGVTGVGLHLDSLRETITTYQQKYNRCIYFVNKAGDVVLFNKNKTVRPPNIKKAEGLSSRAHELLSHDEFGASFERKEQTIHLHSRFISELGWYLVVEQNEETSLRNISGALMSNAIISISVTIIILLLLNITLSMYRKKVKSLQENDERLKEINKQQKSDLSDTKAVLKSTLADVEKLTDLLPICSSCKDIRDENGTWSTMETYIHETTHTEFSHSLCPGCAQKLYPKYQ